MCVLFSHLFYISDLIVADGCLISLGFVQATTGWDPVTGLGTPNFTKLKSIFLGFPLGPLGGLLGGLVGAVKSLSLTVSTDVTVKMLTKRMHTERRHTKPDFRSF
jgi:hypothetical protein